MKRIFIPLIIVTVVTAVLFAGCSPGAAPAPAGPTPAAEEPTYNLRCQAISTAADINSYWLRFNENVEKMSGGRIHFEMYYTGELVPDSEILAALKAGTLDASLYISSCNPSLTQCGQGETGLPYSVLDPTEVAAVYYFDGLKELLEKDYEEYGVKYVSIQKFDPTEILSTKPIEKYEDFQGLKIASTPSLACPFQQAGSTIVSVPLEELYLAGLTGVVDAVVQAGAEVYKEMALYEVYPYLLDEPIISVFIGCFLMNMDVWNSMPEDLQTILIVAAGEESLWNSTRLYRQESSARSYFKVTKLSEEDRAKLLANRQACWDVVAASSPRAAEMVEIYRKFNEELEANKWHR